MDSNHQVLATPSIWSAAARAFSQQKERPTVSHGDTDPDSAQLDTLPRGVVKMINNKDDAEDDFVASKGSHALTTPVSLWNQVIRSISQQKERPSPKSVMEPLETLPEVDIKTNEATRKAGSKNSSNNSVRGGQKGKTLRRESSSKLSQTSSPRNNSDIIDEDMSLDMSRSDSPTSTGLVSRASTTEAKKYNRTSTLAANRNARLKAVGAAPVEPASISGGKGDEKTRAYLGSSNAFETSTLEMQYVYSFAF